MLLPILGLLLLAADLPAETYVWIDEQGVTHLTDDPERVPPGARALHGRAEREALWEGPLGPVEQRAPADGPTDHAEARIQRLLRGAVADLERGENARAAVALEGVLSRQPGRPEAHWYLALLDRHRGRYESAEVHLRAFLASAGEDLEPWRASARRRGRVRADGRFQDAAGPDAGRAGRDRHRARVCGSRAGHVAAPGRTGGRRVAPQSPGIASWNGVRLF